MTAPVDAERVIELMRRLHKRKGRWRPGWCGCGSGKARYKNEVQALAAAESASADLGVPFSAYKCPGSACWHKATRGFTPESLRSRPRIVAWHLAARGSTTLDVILDLMGLPRWAEDRGIRRKIQHVRMILDTFAALGLVTRDDPHPPYVSVASREGLLRVMTTGLDEYVRGLGISWTE